MVRSVLKEKINLIPYLEWSEEYLTNFLKMNEYIFTCIHISLSLMSNIQFSVLQFIDKK